MVQETNHVQTFLYPQLHNLILTILLPFEPTTIYATNLHLSLTCHYTDSPPPTLFLFNPILTQISSYFVINVTLSVPTAGSSSSDGSEGMPPHDDSAGPTVEEAE